MAFKDPLFSAIDMFGGETTYEPIVYSKDLDGELKKLMGQLSADRTGYNKDIGNIEGEVAGAQALYKDATPQDMANLGQIARQSSADPKDLFSFLATQFPGMADAMLGKLNAGGLSAVDKVGLSSRGYGGRGNARSRFETMLATNRMGQAAIPLFQTAMSSIIPGVTALSNVGAQNARTAMEAIAQRGVTALRGVGLSFLPMEAREQASRALGANASSLGQTNLANIFGMDPKDNLARKIGKYGNEQANQIMDLAKTAASMYFTGGMAGMGGMGGGGGGSGAGGIFSQIFGMQKPSGGGGGGGGQNDSSPNYTPYIPVAPQAPSFGYNAPQYQGYQQPPPRVGY